MQPNNNNLVQSKKVCESEAIESLNKFLNKEEKKRVELDSIVYLKEHIIDHITRIRNNLLIENE